MDLLQADIRECHSLSTQDQPAQLPLPRSSPSRHTAQCLQDYILQLCSPGAHECSLPLAGRVQEGQDAQSLLLSKLGCLLTRSSQDIRDKAALWGLSGKCTNRFCESSILVSHLPKVLPPNTITLGVRLQHINLE